MLIMLLDKFGHILQVERVGIIFLLFYIMKLLFQGTSDKVKTISINILF